MNLKFMKVLLDHECIVDIKSDRFLFIWTIIYPFHIIVWRYSIHSFLKSVAAWYRDIDLTVFLISPLLSKASDIKKKDCLLLCRFPNLILSSMLHVRLMIIKLKMKVEILEAYIPELFIKQLGVVARNLHFNKLSLMQVIHKSHSKKYLFLYQTLFIH